MTGLSEAARRKKAVTAVTAAFAILLVLGLRGANAAGDAPDLYIDVPGVSGCTTNSQPPPTAASDVRCDVAQGAQFTVRGFLAGIDGLPDLDDNGTAGYAGVQFRLVYTPGLTRIDHLGDTEFGPSGSPYWPDCAFRTELPDAGAHLLVCLINGLDESTFVGQILEVGFQCTDAGEQTVTLDDAQSYLHNELHQPGTEKDGDEVLTITCAPSSGEVDDGGAQPENNGGVGPGGEPGSSADLPTAGGGPAEGGSGSGATLAIALAAGGAAFFAAGAGVVFAWRRRRE